MGFSSLEEARRVLGPWIEGEYNRVDVHSSLGNKGPQENEEVFFGNAPYRTDQPLGEAEVVFLNIFGT